MSSFQVVSVPITSVCSPVLGNYFETVSFHAICFSPYKVVKLLPKGLFWNSWLQYKLVTENNYVEEITFLSIFYNDIILNLMIDLFCLHKSNVWVKEQSTWHYLTWPINCSSKVWGWWDLLMFLKEVLYHKASLIWPTIQLKQYTEILQLNETVLSFNIF